jgi:hypothetical protein
MNLPKIDISNLPDLDVLTGVFGSLAHPAQALQSNDTLIMMMSFVYDVIKGVPEGKCPDADRTGTDGAAGRRYPAAPDPAAAA